MFNNYLTTAMRNILKNKLFSAINVLGLAVGLAATILLLLFVKDEFSWDQHWSRGEDTYRLEMTWQFASRPPVPNARTVPPLQALMEDTFSEVEETSRFMPAGVTIEKDGDLFTDRAFVVEPNFVRFFEIDVIKGNVESFEAEKSSILISERTALKYFADADPIGKTLTIQEADKNFIVAGVFTNLSDKNHMFGDIIVPFDRKMYEGARWFTDGWQFAIWYTYVRFKPGTDIDLINEQLPSLVDTHMPRTASDSTEGAWDTTAVLDLMPISEIHLKDPKNNQMRQPGDLKTLYTFTGIAFLILGIAIINFLNLTMARTSARSKEVGLRKVMGAKAKQIATQFLSESIVLSLIALVLALVFVEIALPWYSSFLDQILELNILTQPVTLAALIALGVVVGLGAGSYHALHFSVMRPSDVLHSNKSSDTSSGKLRSFLVVAQFAISVTLITASIVITQQTSFARTIDLGFTADNLVIVRGTNGDQSDSFKQALLKNPNVVSVGRSSDAPTEYSEDRIQMFPTFSGGEPVTLDALVTDHDFFKAYDIKLIAGRKLTKDRSQDTLRLRGTREYKSEGNIVINASALDTLGFSSADEALGQTIRTNLSGSVSISATIVGVYKNFHFDSMRNVIRPGIYYVDENRQSDMAVRYKGGDQAVFIASLDDVWKTFFPNRILYASSMKEMVETQYEADGELGLMLVIFAGLAVFVSSLGIFGLSSFTAEKRTKEIAVRKIMGAGIFDIVSLLVAQFSKPVLIANIIAWPIAWIILNSWLSGFVYRVDLGLTPFLMAGFAALLIAWATVGGHAFRVAKTNPNVALHVE